MGYSLLIKPASARCNLRCDYCFYLPRLDQPGGDGLMSEETLERMIKSYLRTRQQEYVFLWQGGEPTLMGTDFFRRAVELQAHYGRGAAIQNALQTNGTLIDRELAALLFEYRFLVGVSLDGPKPLHDLRRRDARGQGSHRQVLLGIERLREAGVPFNLLSLVTDQSAGRAEAIYRHLTGLTDHVQFIPCVDAPHAISGDDWGQFLTEVFALWLPDRYRVSVRNFDAYLSILALGQSSMCYHGGHCRQYFVVEHDGGVYPCDFYVRPELRLGNVCDPGFDLDAAFAGPEFKRFGERKADWPDACAQCDQLDLCSGDCPRHRRSGGPSSLCPGIRSFLHHARPTLRDLALEVRAGRGIAPADRTFLEIPKERNQPCWCGSGKKLKKCHRR